MNEVRIIVLGLLRRGEQYGYQINRALQGDTFREWVSVPEAALYSELMRLAEEGLVESVGQDVAQGRPARSVYRITDAGREELSRLLREAWRDIDRAGTLQEVAAYFADALPRREVIEALEERVRVLEAEGQRLRGLLSGQPDEGGSRVTVGTIYEHRLLRIRGDLSWTRRMLARVRADAHVPQEAGPRPARRATGLARAAGEGQGAFTFVLHSHLPYCRRAGVWPHGEEWIHEATAETYVPLLRGLYDLRDEGVPYKLTISLTPVLTEQLADPDIQQHFLAYLQNEIDAARADIPRFGEQGNAHAEYLATFYRDFYQGVRETFLSRFGGDIIGAFRQLQDEGYIEIITCAATHGYLPLLSRDASIYGQLRTGVESYRRHFGRAPRAIWLPECAYRPAYIEDDGTVRPGLEEFLAGLGITCFFVETHAIEGGRPVGKAAGEVAIGPYGTITRTYVIPVTDTPGPGGTTFRAYYVVSGSGALTDPPVAVIGRNNRTGQQVWSADFGYPGDADYREFHKKDHESGLQYWRVTGPDTDLGDKDWYHPDWAAHKVMAHARHYAGLVEDLLRGYRAETGDYGIISSNYDAELFGHWWFEGTDWICEVLRLLSQSDYVDLTTASEYLDARPPQEAIAVPESSWGAGGTHWTWDNPQVQWLWGPIHEAEERMEALVARYPEATGPAREMLDQAVRELLLLLSSDWPFLMTTGQAKEYAVERFEGHLTRFWELADALERGDLDAQRAAELYELDKVFPSLDYRWFAARQGRAS